MGGRARTIDVSRVALKRRRTRIVATVGPASAAPEALERLVEAGVNVFRLNFSHGTHESHEAVYRAIREVEAKAGRHVAVLADLCGPKIRVGRFEGGGVELAEGEVVTVTVEAVTGGPGLVPSEYRELAGDARVGDRILLDDGKLEMRVETVEETRLSCRVVTGGRLKDRKGMNLPGVAVSAPALTEKDTADALFAAGLGVDYLALSFVRKADDVRGLRELLRSAGHEVPIVAKIEKPEALDEIGAILEAADGIMVARGDLGVEMPAEEVPLIQQELVRVSIAANRPVIVATQMLESMIENPRPTRAEVTDVASAAFAGADAVMLSGETASGAYPVEAVQTMDRVLRLVEGYLWKRDQFAGLVRHDQWASMELDHAEVRSESLSRATAQLSREAMVRTIAVLTRSGRTARMMSAERPSAPILAITDSPRVCRRLALQWGVTPVEVPSSELGDPPAAARRAVVELGLAEPGQPVLLVWDASPGLTGGAPTVTILEV